MTTFKDLEKEYLKIMEEKNILKKHLNLNKAEINVYYELFKSKEYKDIQELVSTLDLDRTSIQRTLNHLIEKELIQRKQINMNRGFKFIYQVNNKLELKKEILKDLNNKVI